MVNLPDIVAWFGSPPGVEVGPFDVLASSWPGEVSYVILDQLRDERVALGWGGNRYNAAHVFRKTERMSLEELVRHVLNVSPRAIHIFGGFNGSVGAALDLVGRDTPRERIAVFTERPGVYGPFLKKTMRRLGMQVKYRHQALKYRKSISLLMPLGNDGLQRFRRFGWSTENIAPFLYVPSDVEEEEPQKTRAIDEARPLKASGPDTVKFAYVGRFTRYTKGTDLLLKAFDNIPQSGWTLDLVGGYGDYLEEVVKWAAGKPQANFSGTWPSNTVAKRLEEYDVVVVPSRFDGWNVTVNYGIKAGIGVLVSDEAVSHELVSYSGAGMVIKSGSASALSHGLRRILRHPPLIREWKDFARSYSRTISPDAVGSYLYELLKAWHLGEERPHPPWHSLTSLDN